MGPLQSLNGLAEVKSNPRPSNLFLQPFPKWMPEPLDGCRHLSSTLSPRAGWLSPHFWITF